MRKFLVCAVVMLITPALANSVERFTMEPPLVYCDPNIQMLQQEVPWPYPFSASIINAQLTNGSSDPRVAGTWFAAIDPLGAYQKATNYPHSEQCAQGAASCADILISLVALKVEPTGTVMNYWGGYETVSPGDSVLFNYNCAGGGLALPYLSIYYQKIAP